MTIRPGETELTAPYWEAARHGVVLLQRCLECHRCWHPPAPVCVGCQSDNVAWEQATGRGSLQTFTVVRRAAHRALEEALPYVVAVVQLEEGPLVVTNLVHCDLSAIRISMPVRFIQGPSVGGEILTCAEPE